MSTQKKRYAPNRSANLQDLASIDRLVLYIAANIFVAAVFLTALIH